MYVYDPECAMTLTQGNIFKFKGKVHIQYNQNLCLGHTIFLVSSKEGKKGGSVLSWACTCKRALPIHDWRAWQ